MTKPWFAKWFGEHYKRLYPHRDMREAEGQVAPLLKVLPVTPAWRILDIGCGSGRHLEVLGALGYPHAVGMEAESPRTRKKVLAPVIRVKVYGSVTVSVRLVRIRLCHVGFLPGRGSGVVMRFRSNTSTTSVAAGSVAWPPWKK